MQNTKIIQFLKCLSKDEFREFGKFVRSPFHNNRKDVIRFYDILKKYYPDFNIDSAAKKNIYEKLYPGKNYDSNVIVLLNSYLYNLGKEFLTILNLREDQFFYRYHFLKGLDKHYSNNLFEKEFKNTEDFLNNEKLNEEYFLRKSLLEEVRINFNLHINRQDKICRNTIHYADLSIYSFLVKLVIMYHGMLAEKNAFNYEFKNSTTDLFLKNFNFEEFIKKLKIENTEHYDYIVYYYYLFMSNYHPENDNYYSKLKDYSFKNFEKLTEVEKSARFHFLIDYCILQIESGNLKFLRESFNIYTEALDKKLYQTQSKDGEIGLIFFRNFVLIGLAAKEYDYIEKFISGYGKEIKGEHSEDLIGICYAMLYFEKKEYTRALDYLSKVNQTYPAFRLGIKHLYAKIYYEISEYAAFFSMVDTYKHFLKNDKTIPQRIGELHSNFLNYTGRLAKIKSSAEHNGLFVLKKEIQSDMNLDFRHKLWLMEKAEELN